MSDQREGFFWDVMSGRAPPPAAATLGKDEFAPTIELKVNFIRPAQPGVLIGEGRVVARGGSIAFLAGELKSEQGDLLATATATARIVTRK